MLALFAAAAPVNPAAEAGPGIEVIPKSEIRFQPLNPARGDSSPQAGVLWGDIREDVPSGALIVFADGFGSPPHLHNVTYRAVVISGAIHNDDPDARPHWMGPGSFWTQPAGEVHVTAAANGAKATAFLEILEGPYRVQPSDEAFDSGERPINVDSANIVWLESSDVTWIDQPDGSGADNGPELALLWGSPKTGERNGSFLKLPPGSGGELRGKDPWLRAIVIRGQVNHEVSGKPGVTELVPGSYFGSTGPTAHQLVCQGRDACLVYVSTEGRYRFVGNQGREGTFSP